MNKWTGAPTDEWAFMHGFYRGPITRAQLAFYLDRKMLEPHTQIVHMSQVTATAVGQELWFCVQEWQADSLEYQGQH